MKRLTLGPFPPLQGRIRLPGSKSLSNRYLLLSALAQGRTRLTGLLESEDTRAMKGALTRLGVHLREEDASTLEIDGLGGPHFQIPDSALDLGNAGTAMRPLAAALCASRGRFTLDGIERMRERPIGDLVDGLLPALSEGGSIRYLGTPGFPPLEIHACGLRGGLTTVRGTTSSQFLTGLLMAAPMAGSAMEIQVEGELISRPYIDITLRLMERFGARVERDAYRSFLVHPGVYRSPGSLSVEGDASSASYFLAFGALAGPVRVEGCGARSVQGDAAFIDVLGRMGAQVRKGDDWLECERPRASRRVVWQGVERELPLLRGLDIDLLDMPDAAMTLATLALFAEGPTTLRGIGSWRVKETERVVAVRDELRKLGAEVEEGPDWIRVTPPPHGPTFASIATYHDHRMAMAFSLVGSAIALEIQDPDCTAKTFPGYFQALENLASGTSATPSNP
ncbi:MAG: 3-phosphoshikimate 1-carboxyvinyltransferase [Fibrobacteria bacterium]|nr:3-phosphoshikimate 1-carboxyvinyltransferase [Fibrobacteria bacterium]